MMINGAITSPTNPELVWSETVNVSAFTKYFFSAWAAPLFAANPAKLEFIITGLQSDNTMQLFLTTDQLTGTWAQVQGIWQSGEDTSAKLDIYDLNTWDETGNDFALDDINFAPIPEPASLLLFGSGIVGGARLLRRKLM